MIKKKKKKSVREIDFGGLFSMRFKSFPVGFIPWLLERFDVDARHQMIGDFKYHIVTEDVHDMFPLPRYSNREVKLLYQKKKKEENNDAAYVGDGLVREKWKKEVDGQS